MDTLNAKKDLAGAGFTDQQADALIEALRKWSQQFATKDDLDDLGRALKSEIEGVRKDLALMEERMNRRLWRAAVTIIAVQIAAMGVFNFLG